MNSGLVDRKYDIGLATLDINWANFNFSRESSTLLDPLRDQLRRFAEFREIFPASVAISAGRSLYAQASEPSDWQNIGIKGIKAKGIAGLGQARGGQGFYEIPSIGFVIVDGLKHVISPPMFTKPFIMSDRVHIAMDSELRLSPKISLEKFWFSLVREGAEREFDCQESLAKYGLGFGALAAGYFADENGQAKVDGLNRQLGGVFLAHEPTAKTVSKYSNFTVFQTEKDEYRMLIPDGDPSAIISADTIIENYIYFAGRVAEIKAQAIFNAGVARHSSHTGNFWYVESEDLVQMSDNDTCLLLKDQPEEMHGAILLRDFSTYINRTIRDLTLNTFNVHFFSGLSEGRWKPMHTVLDALFKDRANPRDINETATAITQEYINFVFGTDGAGSEYSKDLFRCAKNYQFGISTQDAKAGNTDCSDRAKMEWDITHVPFYETIISELYQLCLKSNLADQGFRFRAIDTQSLKNNLAIDLKEVSRVYKQEFAEDMVRNDRTS